MRFILISVVISTILCTLTQATCSSSSSCQYLTPSSLSLPKKNTRNVIVFLLPEFGQALDGLPCALPCSTVDKTFIQTQITMLDTYFLDAKETDIVIFHEGYPDTEDIKSIRGSTSRRIDFVNIDTVFLRIPSALDPYLDSPTWTKRAKWRYQQMIRFMVIDIFQFPVMDNVDYFMRIDFDSCFHFPFRNVFSVMNGPGLKGE